MIPGWMKEVEEVPETFSGATTKKKNFIRKTVDGIFSFFQETIVSEGFTKRNGLLQGLDPRVKLISIFSIVFAVSVVRDLYLLFLVYSLTLVFAYLSKIKITYFIKRVWLFIPIFTGLIVLPMIFNLFTPGDSILDIMYRGKDAYLGPIGLPETLSVTSQGTILAVTFTLRVAACVSAVVLLFLTTPRQVLFKSLRSLKVPKIYVITLDMCYRYIFLFMDIIRDMHIAKKSRTIKKRSTIEEQKWVGERIGYTLIRSINMSEKVHQAMISRGFNGEIKILQEYNMMPRDYVAGFFCITFSVALVLISSNIIHI
ncbi:cobalt ECF transporter T component CbiQ [Methanocella sp. CWC-04]|uniref:Cobalt ECF transporter T component CbiQ n=1 Tax=Methanooceanicella nereidis TaxID=2052831 RepID=A0AAP2RFP4_9EURY|nr:cobalt ECF transporter T component CbiQ [Methanocella sp. CWC-04]MCD1295255.1 cobalt ECF transporter T component CbiQ [Methanocella sp. CWC-04]